MKSLEKKDEKLVLSKRQGRLTEVAYNVFVLQVFEQFNLSFQSAEHALLPFLVRTRASRQFDLLHSHEKTIASVHSEIDFAKGAGTDQSTFDPFVRCEG